MSARIILLGGGGLLGTAIHSQLKSYFPGGEIISTSSRDLNLLDPFAVEGFFKKNSQEGMSVILNAARMPFTSTPRDDAAAMMGNAQMAANVVRSLDPKVLKKLVLVSTIDVYGKVTETIDENTRVSPQSNYAISKYSSELIVERYATQIPLLIFRVSHLFGPGDTSSKLIPSLIKSALSTGKMILSGSGGVKRDFVFVDDAAKIIAEGIRGNQSGTINLATGKSRTALEIAEVVRRIVGSDIKIEFVESTADSTDFIFDSSKLKIAFPIQFGSFESQMRSTIDSYRN